MKLIKVKGVVIKEVAYGDNDKIITLLTDSLGTIACIAKGAKRTKSALLAPSQYLVYSEFILFKGTTFFHINSAEVINTFYNLKMDLDKLDAVYNMTKNLIYLTNENIDTEKILKVFLISLYYIQENKKNVQEIQNVFRIKMIALLGFSPNFNVCNSCLKELKDIQKNVFYDYVSNMFICQECNLHKTSRQLLLSFPTYMYIRYIFGLDITKIFTINLNGKYIDELDRFGQALVDCICNSI